MAAPHSDQVAGEALFVDLSAKRGHFILDAQVHIPNPEIIALFGPSGAGKSVLLDIIAGVSPPDRGAIRIGARVLDDVANHVHVETHQRGIGLVFQDARLFPHLDVAGNLAFAAKRASGRRTHAVADIAAHFDVTTLLHRRVAKLSGGEKARVALARAVLSSPDFLLLDEPFAALDGARRAEFIATLRRLHAAFAIPMLVVTHQIDDAAALANTIVGLSEGRVVAAGQIQEIVQLPAFRKLLAPRDAGAAVLAAALSPPSVANVQAQWVRADHVLLSTVEPTGLSARNIWPSTVRTLTSENDGSTLVELESQVGSLLSRITAAASAELNLSLGQKVWAIVKAHSL